MDDNYASIERLSTAQRYVLCTLSSSTGRGCWAQSLPSTYVHLSPNCGKGLYHLGDKRTMQIAIEERRQTRRIPCGGVVTIQPKNGAYRGQSLVGLVGDISEGGLGVDVDGGQFSRGTRMQVELPNGFLVDCWVCHASANDSATHLGLSFEPLSEDCFPKVTA